jgi:hypothetical protein
MYSLSEFRKLLGPAADGVLDEKIIAIRALEYALADLIIDQWLLRERSRPEADVRRRAL